MKNPQCILIIGFVWPEPKSSAAGSRMMQLIDLFREHHFQITFASTAADSEFMHDLENFGVTRKKILLNDGSFDVFIKQLSPAIVVFDRFMTEEQFGWRVAENCPDALRILDTEDLHCLRQARHLALKQNRQFAISDLFSDVAKREIASIFRSDLTLMISETEMSMLQDVFQVDRRLLYYLPFLLNPVTAETSKEWPLFDEREGFVFVGNFHHEPNRDAVKYLNEAIWPLIRKALPGVKMNIYGAYIPQAIGELHQPASGFYIQGRAEDAAAVVAKARVVLAPLRFGAGIKGKLAEAMICGTPSVTTSIGAESMHGGLPWNGLVADDAKSFAKAAVTLYENNELWQKACECGIEIINKRYQYLHFAQDFIAHTQNTLVNLQQHRLQNFIGAMLMHHSMSATKYMSRWIEEKNRTLKE